MRHVLKTIAGLGLALAVLAGGYGTSKAGSGDVLSGYKSTLGVNGGRRAGGQHAGIDFAGRYGEPVIAASGGTVTKVLKSSGCGKGVVIWHSRFASFTIYCHMSKVAVKAGSVVPRGGRLGDVGTSGNSGDVPHVHFELSWEGWGHNSGDTDMTRDPAEFLVGCYDPTATYSKSDLTLTVPVSCR